MSPDPAAPAVQARREPGPLSPQRVQELTARVTRQAPSVRADLERLVRIPSVSAAAFDQSQVRRSAEAVAVLLREAGLTQVEVLQVQDPATGTLGAPAVVGHRPGPDGAPTVLLYAHHDVQPPGPASSWLSDPFDPVERDGRLFGRGAADDKAGVCVHLAALRALGEDLAVGVSVFIEGEEEVGSPTFETFVTTYQDRLSADVIVVADSGNWRIGVPALTTSLRGNVMAEVEVATLDHAVHSGMFGGAAPDAATALVRTLNSLWDVAGDVAVPGLLREPADLDYPEADFRADAGVLEGVDLIGSGDLAGRLWRGPAVTVIGTDLPSLDLSSNTLAPRATARLSMRVAPGQDGTQAAAALREHLQRNAPWGARVAVRILDVGAAWAGPVDGSVYDTARWALAQAWPAAEPVHMGVGGSIPFIASLQKVYPDATVLVTGVEDPDTRAHGANESVHLGEFTKACLAHTLLLAALGPRSAD